MGCMLSKDRLCFKCNKNHKPYKEGYYMHYLAGVYTLEYCKKCNVCELEFTDVGKKEIHKKDGSLYQHCDSCNEHHFNNSTYCYKCNHCYSTNHYIYILNLIYL